MKRHRPEVFAIALLIFLPSDALAQACAPDVHLLASARATVQQIVSATGAENVSFRLRLQLPSSDTANVSAVTDPGACQSVLTAFNKAAAQSGWQSPLPSSVSVVAVGNVFVAMHPSPSAAQSKYVVYMVLSSQFVVLSRFTG
jgi:hypothetical protein